ncbi:MAG: Rho termination factor [Oscillatoriales cyanobacterium]|uniref:Rho termination factor N-terminal domain-containing protein n=1 Tax=Microcoleus sp. PH2017_05_CCC_O_A TaxID=2798816 RepID=UPI001DC6CF41|nr:Rho termination factor N-terminal domain-containing protein [Microcoleus sp. PH2017_05_CCC_O_A]MCC3436395.1 Rho termination factor N-terminal domain-containing protein [Microcoleus sp. PH2017_05_CCC_O_A]TAF94865.1 MAG: Rho termination factor [Oscillatoriales cyanobacterium]TAG18524.1 MAG: Rho termination factor [Oscillatoriales cyanobacterium]TAG59175.1 MAG: Rho termination factor [Oscillatoriales cyanobacterium]
MKISNILGSLMHLYIDEIDPGDATDAPEFLIKATAKILKQEGGRNWIPVIVKETGEDRYQVISNSFVYAVAEEAGLERVWCIIADDNDDTTTLTKILAGEEKPKINLSTASRDEIIAALQYLIEQPNSELKSVKLAIATNRIDEAPRKYWKNFEPITSLKCGITKGKKLDAIKSVFYLTPQSMPDTINDVTILRTMTTVELKAIAKKRGIAGITKMKKDALIEALS